MKLATWGFLLLAACGGQTVETESTAATPTPSQSPAPAPSASASASGLMVGTPIALPAFRLVGVGPGKVGSVNVHPGAAPSITVDTDAFNVDVRPPGQFDPKTIDQAREHAKSYSGRNERAQTFPDGWALSYENEAVFFANVFRTIAGKAYFCAVSQRTAERRDRAVSFCESLAAK